MEKEMTGTKAKDGSEICVGDRLVLMPAWSAEDLYCKVVDKNTIKWEKNTTLRTDLSYWNGYFHKV